MAVSAAYLGQVSKIDRMFEGRQSGRRQTVRAFALRQKRMALVAVSADDLSVGTHVLSIVATETSVVVVVSEIIGMGLPVQFHLGERGVFEYLLDLGDRIANLELLGLGDVGIFFLVEILHSAGNALQCGIGGCVGRG